MGTNWNGRFCEGTDGAKIVIIPSVITNQTRKSHHGAADICKFYWMCPHWFSRFCNENRSYVIVTARNLLVLYRCRQFNKNCIDLNREHTRLNHGAEVSCSAETSVRTLFCGMLVLKQRISSSLVVSELQFRIFVYIVCHVVYESLGFFSCFIKFMYYFTNKFTLFGS